MEQVWLVNDSEVLVRKLSLTILVIHNYTVIVMKHRGTKCRVGNFQVSKILVAILFFPTFLFIDYFPSFTPFFFIS